MAAEREISVDPLLQRREPLFLEAVDLCPVGDRMRDVGERGAAPESERLVQQLRSAGRIAPLECVLALGGKTLEAIAVNCVGIGSDDIAGSVRLQYAIGSALGLERLPEPRDRTVHGSRSGVWRSFAPDSVDQPLEGNDLVRVQEQESEDGPLLRPAKLENGPVLAYL